MITRRLDFDFSAKSGKLKPVNGMLGIPSFDFDFSLADVYRELSVPVVLFSSREGEAGVSIDLHTVFPDLSLDERFFGSYNFEELDRALLSVKELGAEIILRLGETPNPVGKRPYLRLPTTPERIAEIFLRVIAHCNNGFCGGMKLGVKRVEIWQSPDDGFGFFPAREEYFELYKTVSAKIKTQFPKIKVGAYSSGGFASLNNVGLSEKEQSYVPYLESFLSYLQKEKAPLDFLSWKCRPSTPEELAIHANYARSYLNHYGFKKAESIVSAFSPQPSQGTRVYLDKRYPALLASCLISAVKSDVNMMMYSENMPYSRNNALYTLDDGHTFKPYASYNVMRAFGSIPTGATLLDSSQDYRREIYSLAGSSADLGFIFISTRDFDGILELMPANHGFRSYSIEGIIGGGERGSGFTTRADNIPLGEKIKFRVGNDEVYLIRLYR